jgi:hypothetical protein
VANYVVESYDFQVLHAGRMTDGALGEGPGAEKIYLHVIAISDGDIGMLEPRMDESGNQQHDRLALPRNEEWWVAVDGERAWPKIPRPRVVSHCQLEGGIPKPAALVDDEVAALRKLGVALPI